MNFDLSFEQKMFIAIGVLLAIAAIPLIRNMVVSARFKLQENQRSVHEDPPEFTESGTAIVRGSRKAPVEQLSVAPLQPIRSQSQRPTRTGQAAESYRSSEQRNAVEQYQQNCVNPYDNELIPWTKKLPGDREKLDWANILPDLSDGAALALIRIFAMEGAEEELAQAFAVRPTLKNDAFKREMQTFYTDMLRMLDGIYAPQQIALWQRMLDTLK